MLGQRFVESFLCCQIAKESRLDERVHEPNICSFLICSTAREYIREGKARDLANYLVFGNATPRVLSTTKYTFYYIRNLAQHQVLSVS